MQQMQQAEILLTKIIAGYGLIIQIMKLKIF